MCGKLSLNENISTSFSFIYIAKTSLAAAFLWQTMFVLSDFH